MQRRKRCHAAQQTTGPRSPFLPSPLFVTLPPPLQRYPDVPIPAAPLSPRDAALTSPSLPPPSLLG
eukprot:365128-Chlamydomonas_euryale.AAC.8